MGPAIPPLVFPPAIPPSPVDYVYKKVMINRHNGWLFFSLNLCRTREELYSSLAVVYLVARFYVFTVDIRSFVYFYLNKSDSCVETSQNFKFEKIANAFWAMFCDKVFCFLICFFIVLVFIFTKVSSKKKGGTTFHFYFFFMF